MLGGEKSTDNEERNDCDNNIWYDNKTASWAWKSSKKKTDNNNERESENKLRKIRKKAKSESVATSADVCGMSDETRGDATWDEKCGSDGLPEVEEEKTDSNRKSDAGKYPKNNGIIN